MNFQLDKKIAELKYPLNVFTKSWLDSLNIFTVKDFLQYDLCTLVVNPDINNVVLNDLERLSSKLYKNRTIRPHDFVELTSLEYPISLLPSTETHFKYTNENPSKRIIKQLKSKGISTLKDLIEIDLHSIRKFPVTTRLIILECRNTLIDNKGFNPNDFDNIMCTLVRNLVPKEGQRKALKSRLNGLYTLADAGFEAGEGITRERIRQIEELILKHVSYLKPFIFRELKKLNTNRKQALSINDIEIELSFFRGISKWIKNKNSPLLKEIFDVIRDKEGKKQRVKQAELPDLIQEGYLTNKKWWNELKQSSNSCVESPLRYELIKGEMIFYSKNNSSYNELVDGIESHKIGDNYKNYLRAFGREDLTPFYEQHLKQRKPKSIAGKIREVLPIIFKNQESLISVQEIQKTLKEEFDLDVKTNQIGNLFYEIENLYQFDKGKWGLESKFGKFNEDQIKSLSIVLLQMIKNQENNSESESFYIDNSVLNKIKFSELGIEIGNNIPMVINVHDLNYILKKTHQNFPELNDLGRRYWSTQNSVRSDVHSIAIKFLDDSGRPMSTGDIKAAVEKIRPVGNFQLRPSRVNKELINYSPKLWGLRHRDLALSIDDEEEIVKLIINRFKQGQSMLYREDLLDIMQEININHAVTTYQISRLLLTYISSNPELSKNEYWILRFDRNDYNKFMVIDANYKGDIPDF